MATLTSMKIHVEETTSAGEYLATVTSTFEFAGAEYVHMTVESILVPDEYVQVRDQADHLLMVIAHAFKDLPNSILQNASQLVRVTL